MSIFTELRRRNVFRVGTAYVVSAWLLIQVVETIFPLFSFDETLARVVVIIVAVGFIPTLIFSWVFELTSEGLQREKDIDRSQSNTSQTGKKLDRLIMLVLAIALSYFAFDKFVLSVSREASIEDRARQEGRTAALLESHGDQSIVVLPFVDMSQDGDQEYFSDGISQELLNLLAKIPELRVISRSSAFTFKGKDIDVKSIGTQLNVSHVLEGSVRKAGNRVRITAQLIDARSDTQLWSESFDRILDDVFAIQDDIAGEVVDHLKIRLLGSVPSLRKTNPEAYSLYLQGNYFNNLSGEENLEKALAAYREALALDPDYAPAWVGINLTYSDQRDYDLRPRKESAALAMDAVERALAIDENMAYAWAALAYLKRSDDWDWQGARVAINKALQLEPNNADVVAVAASLANTFGQLSASVELFEQNIELDPLKLSNLRALGNRYLAVGRIDDAFKLFYRVQALNPNYPTIHSDIARAYLMKGDAKNALIEIEKNRTGRFTPTRRPGSIPRWATKRKHNPS